MSRQERTNGSDVHSAHLNTSGRSKTWLIVHHRGSPPGYVVPFIESKGRQIEHVDLDMNEELPPVDDRYEGVVVLGGLQGAYEEDQYPWLKAEKQWLRDHVARGTPILGICLGCQLLADALGGRAYASPHYPEIGIVTLSLTSEGESHPIFSQFGSAPADSNSEDAPQFICHHGDVFEVPPGGKLLAVTKFNNAASPIPERVYPQAFQIGRAIGVQFHPEANATQFARWINNDLSPPGNKYQRYFGIDNLHQINSLVQLRAPCTEATRLKFFDMWWKSFGFDEEIRSESQSHSSHVGCEARSESLHVHPHAAIDVLTARSADATSAELTSPTPTSTGPAVGAEEEEAQTSNPGITVMAE